ncbi:hypothetical protein K493DRAFT_313074 [Basidiobolus meristosporus CBS 931.73]|uniref:L-type lectin-like domain-containing protein n=1 Tax=Basidiobolus meristosporus CBS 931.73 TaxID=1314790 RepID=A0A1Y1YP78_9FUNG|nr:hypothetical protein K493DRAFT_313074 [Basidiobolus meristosporus CBS 931.73]|eukprot:ORX99778.1 hypothetical protein K493DRAFT_313074 [Basidiobolus meristosporus CBS 931.73]
MYRKAVFTFLTLAAGLLSATAQDDKSVYLGSHSLNVPYIDEEMRSNNFEFGGDTVIHTYRGIQLTPDLPSRAGWLWSKHALPTKAWEVEFEFKVHGSGSGVFGDGFAFWATTNDPQTGPVFGSVDRFDGLGLFFDTYANSKHSYSFPYVSAMIGDGKTSYDVGKDGEPTQAGGCEADFRGRPFPTKAKVSYVKDQYLEVKLQYQEEGKWTDCIFLNDISLPNVVYLGFSAHTGEISDFHEILSVTSHSLKSVNKPPRAPQPVHQNTDGSFGFLWKLIAIGTVGGLIYYVYQSNQRNAKRF